MKVLVSGATGMIGGRLARFLEARGDEVVTLTRRPDAVTSRPARGWEPSKGQLAEDALQGIDAVVHLAGESIAAGRWTETQKKRIRDSRVDGTRLLAGAIAAHRVRPSVFVSASAIGFYGDRRDQRLDEEAASGAGFLPSVCRDWEAAADPARVEGVRVVHPRIGVVLSAEGGALPKMLIPFKLGLGGRIGSGRQYMSWIGIDDVVGLLVHALDHPEVEGPMNVTAPEPVTNDTFTKTLGTVLGRPTVIPLPGFAAKLALGEMADELLLSSTRAVPTKALATGYAFAHDDLEACLRSLLVPSAPAA